MLNTDIHSTLARTLPIFANTPTSLKNQRTSNENPGRKRLAIPLGTQKKTTTSPKGAGRAGRKSKSPEAPEELSSRGRQPAHGTELDSETTPAGALPCPQDCGGTPARHRGPPTSPLQPLPEPPALTRPPTAPRRRAASSSQRGPIAPTEAGGEAELEAPGAPAPGLSIAEGCGGKEPRSPPSELEAVS